MSAEPPRLPPALWAAAGLLGLVLPLSLLEQAQSLLVHLAAWELWPLWGTVVVVYSPFVVVLALLGCGLTSLAARLPWVRWAYDRRAGRSALEAQSQVAALLLLLTLAFALHLYVGLWLHTLPGGEAWAARLPQKRWWLLGALLLGATLSPLRRAAQGLVGLATCLSLLGLLAALTLPFFSNAGPVSAVRNTHGDGHTGATRPNLVLVTFDALSALHLGAYGYSRPTSPTLDRLAAQGTLFERFYGASNYTTPGINSLLTSRLPASHRANQLMSWAGAEIRAEALPQVLREAGYQTMAVSTNPLAGPYKNRLGAGFDAVASDRILTYFNGRDGPSRWLPYLSPVLAGPLINTLWRPIALARWFYGPAQRENRHFDADVVFASARELLAQRDGRPVFLWLHLLTPHDPYAAPAPHLGLFDDSPARRSIDDSVPPFMEGFRALPLADQALLRARYDEAIHYLDARLAPFLKELQQSLGPQTVVAVSADHGESFDHGYGGHAGPGLHESLLRIPFIVVGPGVPAGQRLSTVGSQIDIAPTLTALAGVRPAAGWQGRALLGPQGASSPRAAWAMNLEQNPRSRPTERGTVALVDGDWKYVHVLGRPAYDLSLPLQDGLFHLGEDPGEQRDRRAINPAVAERMKARIQRYVQAPDAPGALD